MNFASESVGRQRRLFLNGNYLIPSHKLPP